MPKAELSELLFILIMFIVVTIISVVSIYLFVRQLKREKEAQAPAKSEPANEKPLLPADPSGELPEQDPKSKI
jgi:flagellar basal body-associated protein FliL